MAFEYLAMQPNKSPFFWPELVWNTQRFLISRAQWNTKGTLGSLASPWLASVQQFFAVWLHGIVHIVAQTGY
jgi:hypothetical protein